MERTRNIYAEIVGRLEWEKRLALATIIEAKGSTPQVPGASALFAERGLLEGTLGGGILEADAQEKAVRCLKSGRSLVYDFELKGEAGSEEEAICGGSVSVLIDGRPFLHLETFQDLKKSLHSRRPGIFMTRVNLPLAGEVTIVRHWLEEMPDFKSIETPGLSALAEEFEKIRREGRPSLVKKGDRGEGQGQTLFFLEPLSPPPQLVIVGAGHIGKAVAPLGKLLGFDVTVIDDRADFANRERFPDVEEIIVGDIGPAVASFPAFPDTYIVIVTRGHSHDAEALRACIRTPAAYIGMIGSGRKVALMRDLFLKEGWAAAAEFRRVHAPIGLPIGSKTVEEIAVSIAAELVQTRSRLAEIKSARRE